MLVATVFFLNHMGRKNNLDADDGNKSNISVKKIYPLYLFKKCRNCSICGQNYFDSPSPRAQSRVLSFIDEGRTTKKG